ncbi:Peroxygenase 1 [Exophiala oligosperma]
MAEITTSTYTIRFATESDVPVILELIQELASYEKALHEVLATEKSLTDTLSFPDPKAADGSGFTRGYAKTILVVPSDDTERVAGMALFFHNYSTWTSAPGIYLEDLYRSRFRGGFAVGFGQRVSAAGL